MVWAPTDNARWKVRGRVAEWLSSKTLTAMARVQFPADPYEFHTSLSMLAIGVTHVKND